MEGYRPQDFSFFTAVKKVDAKVTPILGHSINFVQENETMSSYGVMRGLHYQKIYVA